MLIYMHYILYFGEEAESAFLYLSLYPSQLHLLHKGPYQGGKAIQLFCLKAGQAR